MKWLLLKRQSTLPERLHRPNGTFIQEHFNESTGQVFTERIAPIQTSSHSSWASQASIPPDPYHAKNCRKHVKKWRKSGLLGEEPVVSGFAVTRGSIGARSLTDTVLEFLLQNLEDVTPEALDFLPTQVVRRLWYEVNRRCPISFATWKMFSKILHKEHTTTLNLFRYRQQIPDPVSPLPVYMGPLNSNNFDFISSLSLTENFPLEDLVRISKMANLGVLEVVNTVNSQAFENNTRLSALGDQVLRAWALAASDSGAFSLLRVLKLWNHPNLTNKSLEYLNYFPSLAIYDVSGCGLDLSAAIDARKRGWTTSLESNLLKLLEDACVERATLMQTSLGLETKSLQKAPCRQIFDGTKVTRMARADIPKFLTRSEASLADGTNKPNAAVGSKVVDVETRQANRTTERLNEKLIKHESKTQKKYLDLETWDFQTLTMFSKIGELRNDRDLAMAGIDIGGQPLAGDELIPPLPMASLRLGETVSALPPPVAKNLTDIHKNSRIQRLSRMDIDAGNLSFLRIKLPPKAAAVTQETSGSAKTPNSKNNGHLKAQKRTASSMMRSGKKQKLENVLGSFLAG